MSITFNDEAAILDYFTEHGAVWMSLVAADSWPYILTSTEDGDVFVQGFPTEAEEGDAFRGVPVKDGTEWLCDKSEFWYPVRMVAADPQPTDPSPDHENGSRS
jgi:hypothetical protein